MYPAFRLNLGKRNKIIIFESLLTSFKVSNIFLGSRAVVKNGLSLLNQNRKTIVNKFSKKITILSNNCSASFPLGFSYWLSMFPVLFTFNRTHLLWDFRKCYRDRKRDVVEVNIHYKTKLNVSKSLMHTLSLRWARLIWGQFHQHSTSSLYTCKSQKRKKTVMSSSFLCLRDLHA